MESPISISIQVPKRIHDILLLHYGPKYNMMDIISFLLEREDLKMEADEMIQEALKDKVMGGENNE